LSVIFDQIKASVRQLVDHLFVHVQVKLDHLDLAFLDDFYLSQFCHCDFSSLALATSQDKKLTMNTSSIIPAPASRENRMMCAITSLKNFRYSIVIFF